jgi:hypothetical protein
MSEDYKKVVVLNNQRQTRDDAAGWSPREALLDLLREIDQGLEVHELVICYDCGIRGSGFKNCTDSVKNAVGLLQVTQLELYHQGAHE